MFRFIDLNPARPESAPDPLQGLSEAVPQVSPRYFYDTLGCHLFAAITELTEYYPTRLEREIYRDRGADIAESTGQGVTLVDLGAGDCMKAASLLGPLQPAHYVAVDIAGEFLQSALRRIAASHPALAITGVAADFADGLQWPGELPCRRPLFFYPGSSIGNFSRSEARTFLRSLWQICLRAEEGEGDLLIGVDLLKSPARMQAAYDDALGVTASFNLNLLRHLNRLTGSDFDVRKFRHRAQFNAEHHRIEMWLVSVCQQRVSWPGGGRSLREGDAILTECSYKYAPDDFACLLEASGFRPVRRWFDATRGFMVCHARSAAD